MLTCAKAGDLGGQLNLGTFYADGIGVKQNRSKAIYWYMRAYRRQCGAAANNIGIVYRDEKNWNRAIAWFKRAIRLGELDATVEIAKIYIRQRGSCALATAACETTQGGRRLRIRIDRAGTGSAVDILVFPPGILLCGALGAAFAWFAIVAVATSAISSLRSKIPALQSTHAGRYGRVSWPSFAESR